MNKECNIFKNIISVLLTLLILSLATGTVSAYASPAPVDLGTAGDFVILSDAGITTTGTTAIIGDIGTGPAVTHTAITGFALSMDASNQFATSSLVTGNVYAYDYTVPTPAKMNTAILNMGTAYVDAAGRPIPDAVDLGAGDISTMTIAPGLYKWGTGVHIDNRGVTLSGGANDVWIFQIAQDLTVDNTAIVHLSGGAQAKNIFWQVGGGTGVTLGTTSVFNGNILATKGIVMNTGATLNGRALAQTAVTLDANIVTAPLPTVLAPTLGKGFSPFIINVTNVSTLTITLSNPNDSVATLTAPLIDILPTNLTIATVPNASTTCSGTVSATAGGSNVTLSSGSTIPVAIGITPGTCIVKVNVTALHNGSYLNTLAANVLQTSNGNNTLPAIATLTVVPPPNGPPTLGKGFSPFTINMGSVSTLTITLSNPNTSVATLTASLIDILPTGVTIAYTPNASTTCGGIATVNATAGGSNVTLSPGSTIPAAIDITAGTCIVKVDVTAPLAGSFFNTLASNFLRTSNGNNTLPAIATLTVLGTTTTTGGGGGTGGGSGTGGGGLVTSEPYDNIAKSERHDNSLIANTPVTYTFKVPELSIYEIAVTGKENENDIGLRVEVLIGTSKLATVQAPGIVYKNVNVWAGTKRMKEILIRFRVENSWLRSNSLAGSDIKMVKWDGSHWAQIETAEKNKDNTYTYYEAKTDIFGVFAITGLKSGVIVPTATPASAVTETSSKPTGTGNPTPAPTNKVPGFELFLVAAALCLVYLFSRKRR